MTEAIQTQISAITNSVTRAAAQNLYNIAVASGSPDIMALVGTMLPLSAKGVGLAIFYSGVGPNGLENRDNAEAVKSDVLGGNGYLWDDTPLGVFVKNYVTPTLESQGYLPPGFASAAINFVSAKWGRRSLALQLRV